MRSRRPFLPAIVALLAASAYGALAQTDAVVSPDDAVVSLTDAVEQAMRTNPEIAQAQYNKEAIQFERKQAQGLYGPRVDLEASAGARILDNPTRRFAGRDDDMLYPWTVEARGEWVALDFGRRRGELHYQAARVDGASLRVLERSEFIALQIARQYLDILLQERVVAASADNVAFHRALANDLDTGVRQGSISIADQQQAHERLQAAIVRLAEAEQDLAEAKITLRRLTGLDIERVRMPASLAESMPASIDEAVGLARTDNPRVKEAEADVDAGHALARKVKADQAPEIGVDAVGRVGNDIDGVENATRDVQVRAFIRWNVFDSGIKRANYQEMVRRESESRYRLYAIQREAEEDVRRAWTTLDTQGKVAAELVVQNQVATSLIDSYRSQFNIGRRSLLDLLDAQNTRYNVQVRLDTARFSEVFARYQVLAATNRFLTSLGVAPGAGAGEKERERFGFGPSKPAELEYRTLPK